MAACLEKGARIGERRGWQVDILHTRLQAPFDKALFFDRLIEERLQSRVGRHRRFCRRPLANTLGSRRLILTDESHEHCQKQDMATFWWSVKRRRLPQSCGSTSFALIGLCQSGPRGPMEEGRHPLRPSRHRGTDRRYTGKLGGPRYDDGFQPQQRCRTSLP